MNALKELCKKITQTKALKSSSGELEMLFFETVYRVSYILGASEFDRGLCYILYSGLIKLSASFLFIAEICHPIMDTVDLDDVAASLNVMVIQVIAYYRYKSRLSHRDLYRKLELAMESKTFDISTEHRKKIVEYWSTVNQNYLKLLLGIGNLTLMVWIMYPLLDDLEYNLVVGLKLPFEYRTPRYYAVTYVILTVVFYYVSVFVIVEDVRLQTYFLHLICQFNVLADSFENIVEDSGNEIKDASQQYFAAVSLLHTEKTFQETFKKRLGGLVERHKSLLRLTLELRECLSGPMLGQLAASGFLICFIGYQAATTVTTNITKCLMSLFFLGYNLFGFYIICRWCEEIKTQSENIGTAVYCSRWETGIAVIPTVRSSLMLVMARANKPVVMTAGGMYELSVMAYSSIVKTSYTALTVLLRFRN